MFAVGIGDFNIIISLNTFGLKLSNIIRMSTPLVPFMDGITFSVRAVFVPLRLLWTHWEEFIGANKGAGYQKLSYLMPVQERYNLYGFTSWNDYANLSLSYKLGKNLHCKQNVLTNNPSFGVPFSILKERGYYAPHFQHLQVYEGEGQVYQ